MYRTSNLSIVDFNTLVVHGTHTNEVRYSRNYLLEPDLFKQAVYEKQ